MIQGLIEKDEFTHSYQYLYRLENMSAIGAEFLFRAEQGNPEFIFQMARETKKLYELDTKSIDKALQTYYSQQTIPIDDGLLFINICPSTILHNQFPSFVAHLVEQFPQSCKNVVFEICESEKASSEKLLIERINFLKKLGYKIAVDDVGKGWSSLNLIIELDLDFIKLDRYFSIDLAESPKKQKMIQLLLNFFRNTKTRLVIEGIETSPDLQMAQSLGVHFCQGYLLSKPMPVLEV